MASDRDHQAARLRRVQQLSYEDIAVRCGYSDRRAAHRGVARALAEPATKDAMRRGLARRDIDEHFREGQRVMWRLLEHAEVRALQDFEYRTYSRVMSALFRLSVERCRLWGLHVHPWRYDKWYRRDVPVGAVWRLHALSAVLEQQARIPLRFRSAPVVEVLAEVVPLRLVAELPAEVAEMVPASVRRLLTEAA